MTDTLDVVELSHSRGWVSTKMLAAIFEVDPRTIQRHAVKNNLPIPVVQIGRDFRFPIKPLNRFLIDHGADPLTDERLAELAAQVGEK